MTVTREDGTESDQVRADRGIERRPWGEFFRRLVWHQGEHVTLVGPTGCGKSVLSTQLMQKRSYVVALGTKPTLRPDPTLEYLHKKGGYKLIRSWDRLPTLAGRNQLRALLWPKYAGIRDRPNQRVQMATALDTMFASGSWAVWADELWYLENRLGLSDLTQEYWTQSRALQASLVGATQRPRHVSLLAYDQATHLFFWRDNDEDNLRRIAGLGGLNSKAIRATVAGLPTHDALYVNTRTGDLFVTRAEKE